MQVGERRRASPDIIERDQNTCSTQSLQFGQDATGIGSQKQRFRDFQFESGRIDCAIVELFQQAPGEIRLAQLSFRRIEADQAQNWPSRLSTPVIRCADLPPECLRRQ